MFFFFHFCCDLLNTHSLLCGWARETVQQLFTSSRGWHLSWCRCRHLARDITLVTDCVFSQSLWTHMLFVEADPFVDVGDDNKPRYSVSFLILRLQSFDPTGLWIFTSLVFKPHRTVSSCQTSDIRLIFSQFLHPGPEHVFQMCVLQQKWQLKLNPHCCRPTNAHNKTETRQSSVFLLDRLLSHTKRIPRLSDWNVMQAKVWHTECNQGDKNQKAWVRTFRMVVMV